MTTDKPRLLCLCDSPTLQTGFARVAQNLIPHWQASGKFERIDVWGIGYEGWPHELPFRIFPAQSYAHRHWFEDANLQRFLGFLEHGGYTHLWMVQDLFHIARMAKALREICSNKGVQSLLYYPVDAPIDPAWMKAIRAVDTAVAYTEYGYAEVKKCIEAGNLKKHILPHGTNLATYYPLPDRKAGREMFTDAGGRRIIEKDSFLVVNVNAHQKRKGILQTLQTFKALLPMIERDGRRAQLYLHMPVLNADEGSDLRAQTMALGLKENVLFADGAFTGNATRLGEEHLRIIYNAADLLLTTTLGEGWGLSITEAMACGTPVAGPRHTSVEELLGGTIAAGCGPLREAEPQRGVLFDCNATVVLPADNNRLRPVTNPHDAANMIAHAVLVGTESPLSLASMALNALQWVNLPQFRWEAIAGEWIKLMDL